MWVLHKGYVLLHNAAWTPPLAQAVVVAHNFPGHHTVQKDLCL